MEIGQFLYLGTDIGAGWCCGWCRGWCGSLLLCGSLLDPRLSHSRSRNKCYSSSSHCSVTSFCHLFLYLLDVFRGYPPHVDHLGIHFKEVLLELGSPNVLEQEKASRAVVGQRCGDLFYIAL